MKKNPKNTAKMAVPRCAVNGYDVPSHEQVGGAFHFHFLYEYFRRPFPYPERVVEWTMKLDAPLNREAAGFPSWLDLDCVYCVTRAYRQCGAQAGKVRAWLWETARRLHAAFSDRRRREASLRDSHQLVPGVALLAELSIFLPEAVRTARPLRQVLDRRPFI